MMKMKIVMDEDKIIKENKYDLTKINGYLENLFQKRGMKKESDWYVDGDFTTCGSIIINLTSKDWFMDNIEEWLWYDEDDDSIEDLKAHYHKGDAAIA